MIQYASNPVSIKHVSKRVFTVYLVYPSRSVSVSGYHCMFSVFNRFHKYQCHYLKTCIVYTPLSASSRMRSSFQCVRIASTKVIRWPSKWRSKKRRSARWFSVDGTVPDCPMLSLRASKTQMKGIGQARGFWDAKLLDHRWISSVE